GNLVAELSYASAVERARPRWDERFESGWWNAVIFAAVLLLFAIFAAPQQDADESDDLALRHAAPHIVKVIPVAPPPVTPAAGAKPAAQTPSPGAPARVTRTHAHKTGIVARDLFGGPGMKSLLGPGLDEGFRDAVAGLGKTHGPSVGDAFNGLDIGGVGSGPN